MSFVKHGSQVFYGYKSCQTHGYKIGIFRSLLR